MSNTDQASALSDFLWELLTDAPPSLEEQQEQITQRVVDALEDAGFRGISNEQLVEALEEVSGRITTEQESALEDLSGEMNLNLNAVSLDLSSSLTQDFEAGLEAGLDGLRVEQIEPLKTAIANQPTPVVNRHVTNVTNIDDRQTVNTSNIVHDGGILEQQILQGDDGAVVVGGDVEDSAVNTGDFDGAQAGGDVNADGSIIGDENTAVLDSEVDALAIGGDAVSVDAAAPPAPDLPIDEPVIDEAPIEEIFDDGAAAEAEAVALEAELDA